VSPCLSFHALTPQFDTHQRSENIALGAAERGKQSEEPIAPMQTSTPDGPSSPVELDSNENRALWKSILRARKRDGKEASVRVTQETSSEVVEIFAARGFKVTLSSSFSYDCSYSVWNNSELFRTNGIIRPSHRADHTRLLLLRQVREGRHKQVHRRTVSLCTHIHHHMDNHRHLLLETQVNFRQELEPIGPMMTLLRARVYRVPALSSSRRYVIHVDTTPRRTSSMRMSIAFVRLLMLIFRCSSCLRAFILCISVRYFVMSNPVTMYM